MGVKYEMHIEFFCRLERPGHIRKDDIKMHLKYGFREYGLMLN
jgi:hypothetical protein